MTGKYYIYTLGCRVNQYESRAISEEFRARGYDETTVAADADFKIINTCAVTGESERKSMQAIRRIASAGSGRTYVVGCCGVPDEKKIPGVYYSGPRVRRGGLTMLAENVLESLPERDGFEELNVGAYAQKDRARAFIKIEDGCSNRCSYCIIPSLRGPVRLRDEESALEEIRRVTALGTQEIVLTGIEISAYRDLAGLIGKAAQIDTVKRIRLGSLDPRTLTEEFTAAVGACEKFMPHIHVSLQSGSPSVLSRMNRPYDAYQASQYIERALRAIPRLKLSADIIAGFPGETNGELEETVSFLKQYPFVHVHTFPYSQRKNTKAADMDGQLSGTEKRERCLYIIQESEKIRRRILEKKIGERAMVLTEKCRDGVSSGMSEDYIETHFNASSKPGTVTDVTVIDVTDTAAGGSALTAKVP